LKCPREGHDVEKRNIALTPFDTTNVVSMKARQLCQFFLRQTLSDPEFAHMLSEDGSGVGGWESKG
jgi:hypothetical protein